MLVSLFLSLSYASAAPALKLQKTADKTQINLGDTINILLNFTNPFGKELPIRIVDKNVLGNNGLDIQCLEYTLPPQSKASFSYEPIKPYKSGKYSADAAKATYTNPETGKEETAESNKLTVTVKGSGQQGEIQGITAVYRCNGVNMQSTSFTSSGQARQENPQNGQQQSPAGRVQNNQQSQNTNELKMEIQQNQQQQSQNDQAFQQNLANNPEFMQKHAGLLNAGYNATAAALNAQTPDTGSFDLSYANAAGGTASLKGQMQNNTITEIMSQTSEGMEKMMLALLSNSQFQKHNKQLLTEGFNASQPTFGQKLQNYTRITVPYTKNMAEAAITADYLNGSIKNVKLSGNIETRNAWLPALLAALSAIILGMAIMRHINRSRKKENTPQPAKPTDYAAESKSMLDEAERLFANRQEKDAHEKVAQAIRHYFSMKLEMNGEITSAELFAALKKAKPKQLSELQHCISLCSMVEFAKYQSTDKEFNSALATARKIVA